MKSSKRNSDMSSKVLIPPKLKSLLEKGPIFSSNNATNKGMTLPDKYSVKNLGGSRGKLDQLGAPSAPQRNSHSLPLSTSRSEPSVRENRRDPEALALPPRLKALQQQNEQQHERQSQQKLVPRPTQYQDPLAKPRGYGYEQNESLPEFSRSVTITEAGIRGTVSSRGSREVRVSREVGDSREVDYTSFRSRTLSATDFEHSRGPGTAGDPRRYMASETSQRSAKSPQRPSNHKDQRKEFVEDRYRDMHATSERIPETSRSRYIEEMPPQVYRDASTRESYHMNDPNKYDNRCRDSHAPVGSRERRNHYEDDREEDNGRDRFSRSSTWSSNNRRVPKASQHNPTEDHHSLYPEATEPYLVYEEEDDNVDLYPILMPVKSYEGFDEMGSRGYEAEEQRNIQANGDYIEREEEQDLFAERERETHREFNPNGDPGAHRWEESTRKLHGGSRGASRRTPPSVASMEYSDSDSVASEPTSYLSEPFHSRSSRMRPPAPSPRGVGRELPHYASESRRSSNNEEIVSILAPGRTPISALSSPSRSVSEMNGMDPIHGRRTFLSRPASPMQKEEIPYTRQSSIDSFASLSSFMGKASTGKGNEHRNGEYSGREDHFVRQTSINSTGSLKEPSERMAASSRAMHARMSSVETVTAMDDPRQSQKGGGGNSGGLDDLKNVNINSLPLLPKSSGSHKLVQCQWCPCKLLVPPNLQQSSEGIQKLRCAKCRNISLFRIPDAAQEDFRRTNSMTDLELSGGGARRMRTGPQELSKNRMASLDRGQHLSTNSGQRGYGEVMEQPIRQAVGGESLGRSQYSGRY